MKNELFYDGHCPICAHEIKFLARFKDEKLQLIDIHSNNNQQHHKTKHELLAVLHLRTDKGVWLTGLNATVAAWQHTPFGIFFKMLRWPLIKQCSDWLYTKWASKRQCRLS